MKGSAPSIIGIFLLLLILITFIMDKSIFYTKQVDITAGSVKLYEVENSVESLKRSVDSAAKFSAERAIYEYGLQQKILDEKSLTAESAKAELELAIKEKISSFAPAEINKKDISWAETELKFSADLNKIKTSGSRPFSVKNRESPNATIFAAGKFESETKTKLFSIIAGARILFDETDWAVSQKVLDSEPQECKEKFSSGGTIKTKALMLNALLCGYKASSGVRSFSAYDKDKVDEKARAVLAEISKDMKEKSGFDFSLEPEIKAEKAGANYKVSVMVSGSAADPDSIVPADSAPGQLVFKFSSKAEFEMAAPAQVSQG